MRICSPQLGLAPESILGGEVFDREILLGLAKKGIEIEIIIPKNKQHDKFPNWKINYFPVSHFPAFFYNFFILPYMIKIYLIKPFDILRIHQPQFVGLGSIFFKLLVPKIKLVATYHQFRETKFSLLSKIINNFWDHIICDSENVKNKIIKEYKVSKNKVTVVHNGIPSYLQPAAKDHKLLKKLKLENKIVLLYMGLFIERKNPLFLIDVLKKVSEKNPDVCIIFWGRGPLKSEILEKAKKLRIFDKVRIVGPIFGEEKSKIHNLADIFVHPSLDEGFALAPLEAMACAKPVVITSGYSAVEAVEDGINGYLCHANDLDQWSNQIIELINDSKLRIKMGQASLAKVKGEFQWEIAAQKHLEVFNRLLK